MLRHKNILIAVVAIALIAIFAMRYLPITIFNGIPHDDNYEEKPTISGPDFSADSAYTFCKEQCDFGPRPMNTPAHEKCLEWIVGKFRQYKMQVSTQQADLAGYDGTTLHATNIKASYRPELKTRILICAHWDSRPWADNDPDETNWHTPIVAANDAASGVAVMLEIARLLAEEATDTVAAANLPEIGIDFVCFDAEDWGTPQWEEHQDNSSDTWALGAKHFAQNLPQGYEARYGILLDMVGGQGARFYQEAISLQYAPSVVEKVWQAARQAGYGSYFPFQQGNPITDDHLPLNEYARIPTIDIIPLYPDCPQSSFGPTWHTVDDDLAHIDKQTLKAVGQTIVQVIWNER